MTYKYTYVFTLFCVVALNSSGFAQASPCGTAVQPADTDPIGEPLAPGSFEPGELILHLDKPMVDPLERSKLRELVHLHGGETLEWSPTYTNALIYGLEFLDCEIVNGDGKPLGDAEGQGQNWTWSLNYMAGTVGWVSEDTLPCGEPTINPEQEGINVEGYNPVDGCYDAQEVVPPTGSNNVKIAIIDSGVKNAGTQGYINGVYHQQTIIPSGCSGTACAPITTNIHDYSRDFAAHGRQIAHLISGWFRSRDMEDQINIHSYKVLDENLHCNIFQVVKAIELATDDYGANLINLSIGFTPLGCGNSGQPQANPADNIIRDAIRAAEAKGVIVVAAAGNSCKDLEVSPEFPAAQSGINNLIVVGALRCGDKERAPWSNYGEDFVDLFAPGDRVKIPGFGCDEEVYGTSFAAPIVTAKAAFHITNQQQYDYQEVLCLLRSQAEPMEGAVYGFVSANSGAGECGGQTPAPHLAGPQETSFSPPELSIAAYPNPARESVTLVVPEELNGLTGKVSILDPNGRELLRLSLTGGPQTINLEGFTPGIYWLRVATERGNSVTRVLKR